MSPYIAFLFLKAGSWDLEFRRLQESPYSLKTGRVDVMEVRNISTARSW